MKYTSFNEYGQATSILETSDDISKITFPPSVRMFFGDLSNYYLVGETLHLKQPAPIYTVVNNTISFGERKKGDIISRNNDYTKLEVDEEVIVELTEPGEYEIRTIFLEYGENIFTVTI